MGNKKYESPYLATKVKLSITIYSSPERAVGSSQRRDQITFQAKKVKDGSRKNTIKAWYGVETQ